MTIDSLLGLADDLHPFVQLGIKTDGRGVHVKDEVVVEAGWGEGVVF